MAKEVVLRQLFCGGSGCGLMFYICSSCYRRQVYCGDRCRRKARRQQRRAANRRNQQTREGRLDHRDRQRAYRERLRRVTDHTSPGRGRSVNIGEPVEELPDWTRFERLQSAIRPVCILCGRGGRVGVKKIGPER